MYKLGYGCGYVLGQPIKRDIARLLQSMKWGCIATTWKSKQTQVPNWSSIAVQIVIRQATESKIACIEANKKAARPVPIFFLQSHSLSSARQAPLNYSKCLLLYPKSFYWRSFSGVNY